MTETIKLEIEIPAPPEGWGDVEWRKAVAGEQYFNDEVWVTCSYCTNSLYPVARKLAPLWTPPPEWHAMFGDCWLTRDRHSNYQVHQTKPYCFSEYGIWEGDSIEFYICVFRHELFPPSDIPWEKCCFKIGDPKE